MSFSGRMRASLVTVLLTGGGALFAAGCGILSTASPAVAKGNVQTIFEVPELDHPVSAADAANTIKSVRWMGADMIRLNVTWAAFAPDSNSRTRPSNFNASSPGSYDWSSLDTVVNAARQQGLGVDLLVSGGAPLWATGANPPPCNTAVSLGLTCYQNSFEPSASDYGQFVTAVGRHFGSRVRFWELWDEANWGPALAPQYLHSSVPVSAKYYRGLVNAGYRALQSTGHGHDTISIANLSQDGSGPPSQVGETKTSAPLIFMRTLYCLNGSYHHLTGKAARQAGCPTSSKGFRSFRSANPGLFKATGVGDHPYPYGHPPTRADFPNKDGAEFAELPQVLRALDRMQKAYGSGKHLDVYNTEYGYRTRPNDTANYFATPAQAAQYLNQAEYITWKNPRITTYDQYELVDEGWFPTGLFWAAGTAACPGVTTCPKPSFYSFRMPLWLPRTSTKRGKSLEVWGNVRPARYARQDTGKAQNVQIQFAPSGSSSFRTVKTVKITNQYGYFDVHVKFPGSGSVQLAWSYPSGDARLSNPFATNLLEPAQLRSQQATSRVVSIKLH